MYSFFSIKGIIAFLIGLVNPSNRAFINSRIKINIGDRSNISRLAMMDRLTSLSPWKIHNTCF